jgi:AcrR family transcriptional regulator
VTVPGARAQKKLATRRALSAATQELAMERGLNGFTLEEVSAAAGVSARTFFNHFPSKEAAMLAADPQHIDEIADRLARRPLSEEPVRALAAAVLDRLEERPADVRTYARQVELVRRHPELLPYRLSAVLEIEGRYVEVMASRLGSPPDDPFPVIVVSATMAAFRAVTEWWRTTRPAGVSVFDALDQVAAHLSAGLGWGPEDPAR